MLKIEVVTTGQGEESEHLVLRGPIMLRYSLLLHKQHN